MSLAGERYKTITKETAGVLKGEYGATPAPVNQACSSGCWMARNLSVAVRLTCSSQNWTS